MKNSYPQIDLETKKFLTDFKSIIDSLEVPMLLIGAQARILIFDSQYQVQGRATKDWDVAVQLDNWDRYNLLISIMTTGQNPLFKKTKVIHKFIHIETELEVDVIPFGDISKPNQEINWPDGNQMNILGLEEAFANTEIIIIDNLEIRVADIDAFIALKLLAWNNRREKKDLKDIITVLRKSPNEEDQDRVYDEFFDEIIEGRFEVDEAAIIFIGRNIQNKFKSETINKVKEIVDIILEQDTYISQCMPKILDIEEWDETFDKIVKRFESLQYGLTKDL
ncbi:nucleotidyl transferase AbiEii/AbiGii toxin family protein [Aphanizomenon flos-aquae NRERC-008]|jgi:predicted nucleotidyltransferase|uniref:Nucleotidyl transferase AbiEii/AbiGii toxin family protein n=1 Tax=Aphanizomenon flos-aquae FACHB-1249 TaxID=2692889 RepID=A0ABR8IQ02_APHFL|nr:MULTISPECIES: nucleotidyl transferase AbiEii/AbiGii toxin family protein [Aphanizomenon]MCE2904961.1 nucleotidyl transferase AbiEii/AbiGii toxin family protein [Anabaena sp. CoA2_C59]MDJ0507484.1 nucleotidyl transferase AbiEii/AbiGii toxin family protein [Nostocales cyanobacterium LE14-WE12]MBD2390155.1 nucleotidyl transferase AbiEii/AbiGii toxin family protein [Aphanizomenon flos-aquae FACHB-1171]MBD2556551.1 nucleotidyl transferase AbiEii/AbiGii toxin family protein [Aphanizomenon flos-aqu